MDKEEEGYILANEISSSIKCGSWAEKTVECVKVLQRYGRFEYKSPYC